MTIALDRRSTVRSRDRHSPKATGFLGRAVSGVANAVRRVTVGVKRNTAVRNLASMPLTLGGFGCIDAGVFMINMIAGVIVTGVLLLVLEHIAADSE